MSVLMPALNMITITPSSATWLKKSLGWMKPSAAGPIKKARQQRPHHLGHLQLAGQHAECLGGQQDQRHIN